MALFSAEIAVHGADGPARNCKKFPRQFLLKVMTWQLLFSDVSGDGVKWTGEELRKQVTHVTDSNFFPFEVEHRTTSSGEPLFKVVRAFENVGNVGTVYQNPFSVDFIAEALGT